MLLDGHSLAYRAFFALPAENFSTSTGQYTNAVYGFTSMLINVLRDEEPTHIGVAFDLSRQTFRTQEYAEYKATRSATPEPFRGQVALVQEVLDALRIRHLSVEGFEADDIIATLTTQASAAGLEVLIVSGDRNKELNGRYEESAYFWRMMKEAGHKDVEILELQGYDHGGMAEPAFPLLLKFVMERSK